MRRLGLRPKPEALVELLCLPTAPQRSRWAALVHEKGLEPSRLASPEPKPGASAIPPLVRVREPYHRRMSSRFLTAPKIITRLRGGIFTGSAPSLSRAVNVPVPVPVPDFCILSKLGVGARAQIE